MEEEQSSRKGIPIHVIPLVLNKNRLYQMNQEPISYWTYENDTEIIDTVMNWNNMNTAVETELLNRTLYYDMGQF